MRIELPVRLALPLYLSIVFVFLSVDTLFDALELGFWKYIIGGVAVTIVYWLLEKSGLTEKEVPIWAGTMIIIIGFFGGLILSTVIENYM